MQQARKVAIQTVKTPDLQPKFPTSAAKGRLTARAKTAADLDTYGVDEKLATYDRCIG